ncbi:hypothetical protein I7I50_07891 [Histoplasma capsulatum G186AR]|uniref:Uncharacterized protein n=1 Tax=Ajellomyces capsulatus TaxID=5037 RepID=A0A8H7YKD4_AJECA|nr:hypothetical protein I7I52_08407 [Histoplasma capsulatum]QSS68467.1 hypothetical protein I7I50_07891 [Histoplasma capsulatum G186AR]
MFFHSALHCSVTSDILLFQFLLYKNSLCTTFPSDLFSLSFLNQFIICYQDSVKSVDSAVETDRTNCTNGTNSLICNNSNIWLIDGTPVTLTKHLQLVNRLILIYLFFIL